MLPISRFEDLLILFATPLAAFGLTCLWAYAS